MEHNDIVVDVNDVTVRYNLASEKTYDLKDYIIKMIKGNLKFTEFFALKNVSVKINKGESWAIIGKNGAGKSTLLKTICGIVMPYKGTVKQKGQIASMIELSAGMDPNLTAEENIYLNGAILGHNRKYMREHFDEIVEFAELKDFMGTPIKNFSSGMRARLGFAVATISQPDILIIDEVLSVGDKDFRLKCENRIQEMLNNGATLIFVSHSMPQVKKLCNNTVWLDHGEVKMIGKTEEVCSAYVGPN